MRPMSKQKREHTDALYDGFGFERPQPLFGPGDIPTCRSATFESCPPGSMKFSAASAAASGLRPLTCHYSADDGPGPVTSQVEPEREASGQDVLKAMREAREVLAAGEDESVFVGAVDGEAYFLPRGLADGMKAVWEPRMERGK